MHGPALQPAVPPEGGGGGRSGLRGGRSQEDGAHASRQNPQALVPDLKACHMCLCFGASLHGVAMYVQGGADRKAMAERCGGGWEDASGEGCVSCGVSLDWVGLLRCFLCGNLVREDIEHSGTQ